MCVVDGNWSAFEHTLTPLGSVAVNSSFLGLAPWNKRNETAGRDHHFSSVSDVETNCLAVSEQSDVNTKGSVLFHMSTSSGIIGINNDDCVTRRSTVTCISSQLLANVSSVSSPMLRDVHNCHIVGCRQMIDGHDVKDSQRRSQAKDQFTINRPVRGKENIRPSRSRSELPKLSTRKHLDSENQAVDLCAGSNAHNAVTKLSSQRRKYQESDSLNHWRSPLRLSVNNVRNIHSTQSPLDDHKEHTDTNGVFSALSLASNDSFDSYIDERSPVKFSDDGLNARTDGVHKRSSSTPVKDQTLQEPIRFRRQQHGGSPDHSSSPYEAGQKQGKSSCQHLCDISVPVVENTAPFTRLNDESSIQRTLAQLDNTGVEMNARFTDRLSSGALSTCPLSDDSLIIADTTYESTVLLPLPAPVSAESVDLPQDTSCPEVGTQTSLLLHSNDNKTYTPLVSGNC